METNTYIKKTYLSLVFLLFTFIGTAQVVSIPDAYFKGKLLDASPDNLIARNLNGNYFKIDANEDGEIQQSEALQVESLYFGAWWIENLTGIEYFTNLVSLDCSGNYFTSLDVTGLTNLRELNTSSNHLLTSLNVSGLTGLQKLYCFDDNFTSLNVSGLTSLQMLNCSENHLTSLNVSDLSSLQVLDCSANLLTSLDVSSLTSLQALHCSGNSLTSLDVNGLTELETLSCAGNSLTSLNVSGLTNLQMLNCTENQLTSLNTSGLTSLQTLNCHYNQLTSLDVSDSLQLDFLNCHSNSLVSLFMKNGFLESYINFSENPSLQYICADENQIASIQDKITEFGYDCHTNSYCSFNPNGNYNTLTGTATYDNENDGCDTNDETFEFLRLNLTDGTTSGSTFTNALGNYNFYANAGNFTITPQLENPTYFTVSPTSASASFTDNLNNTTNQYFCITPNGTHNDLEVVLAQTTPARPGFDAEYSLVYKNKGNQPISGDVTVTFDDDKLDFVSSSQTVSNQQPSALTWNYTNLLPFENRSIVFTLNVNSPTETPAVNNDDILNFSATITPVSGDEIPADNTYSFHQTVVGSFDPNDIYCLEGENVDPAMIGEYLHYNVRFENTGTAAAENIVVATTINPNDYDLSTLQVLNASHHVYTRMTGNLVEFIFENIQLPASSSGGHGNILFKIRSKDDLNTNDDVMSNANIFFDYNFPVATNDANTTFATLSNQVITNDNSVKIYPNPATTAVTVAADNDLDSITVYDAQGRIVEFIKVNGVEKTIDVTQLSKGIYILDIVSQTGRKIEKLIKE